MPLKIRNPHSVLAALQTRPKDVLEVVVPQHVAHADPESDAWAAVAQLAAKKKIPVMAAAKPSQDRGSSQRPNDRGQPRRPKDAKPEEGGRTGVAEATLKEREPLSVEELFSGATDRAGGKGLWIALDSLQDPHNVGAIFRTAAFFGVQGILMTQERSAPLSSVAYDVSSGGIEHVPFAMQVNLQRAFEVAKDKGLWILGTSEHAQDDLSTIERDRPWLLVLGNEEKGMRRLTEERCDLLCKISPRGGVTSLNVSVAAGIFIARLSPSA